MSQEDTMVALISEGVDRAKLGEATAIYDAIAAGNNPIPPRSHYAFGWIIYYALHQTEYSGIAYRKNLLASYLSLNTPRPHKLHSMILNEAIRLREDAVKTNSYPKRTQNDDPSKNFSIVRFLPLWDTSYLRPGDWRRHELNGKTLSSTVEKLITLYVGEIEKSALTPSPVFMDLIEHALKEYPDSYNLLCQRASLHSMADERYQAAALLKKALVMAPGKFHIWSRLAALIETNSNPRLKMALLARSLSAPGPAEFKGRIRIDLAEIWVSQKMPQQAAFELAEVKRLYDAKQWHLPRAYTRIAEMIPSGTAPADTASTYAKLLPMADAEIYATLPPATARKTYHKDPQPAPNPNWRHDPEPAWRVTDDKGNNFWFQPLRFGIDPSLPLGTPLEIRILNGKLVHAALLC